MTAMGRHEYLRAIYDRYRRSSAKVKGKILDEFCRVCDCHRKHAIRLLRGPRPAAHPRLEEPAAGENRQSDQLRAVAARLDERRERHLGDVEGEIKHAARVAIDRLGGVRVELDAIDRATAVEDRVGERARDEVEGQLHAALHPEIYMEGLFHTLSNSRWSPPDVDQGAE